MDIVNPSEEEPVEENHEPKLEEPENDVIEEAKNDRPKATYLEGNPED